MNGEPPKALARAADIYALGCTAYEMLTGVLPFDGSTVLDLARLHAGSAVTPPSQHRAALAPFDAVLLKALSKDPSARFRSAGELGEALRAAVPSEGEAAPTRAPAPRADDRARVLVVDDNPAIARYATRAAQLAFYRRSVTVETACSGEAALAIAARERPDLVILDYAMPGLDGIETLSRLRELPAGESVRVLVFSANTYEGERFRFSLLGVNEFLRKPMALGELVRAITSAGEAAGLLRPVDAQPAASA